MSCSLVDLSDDILLGIIQTLLKDDEILHEESSDFDDDQNDGYQNHRDLMNWSCTSRYFRNLLAPYIFKSVRLCNDEASGVSVDAVRKGPYGALVKGIHFVGNLLPDMFTDRDERENPAKFPAIVDSLLSDLHQFPNIESLSIGFTFPSRVLFKEYWEVKGYWDKPRPQVPRLCKALMMNTYEALLRNRPPHLQTVEIRKFLWIFIEPYGRQRFQELLSHVKHFSLSVLGEDDGGGWSLAECISRVDELFFDHLASATSLILKASDQRPLSLAGMLHGPLRLRLGTIPLLKSLRVEHIFICPELFEFVMGQANTLEQLILHNCYSSVNPSHMTYGFYWSHFLNALHGAGLKKLAHLEIQPWNAPLTYEEYYLRKHQATSKEPEPDRVQQIRRVLNGDARRRVFGYGVLRDNYGVHDVDGEETQAAFERGEDQLAYDNLMNRIDVYITEGRECQRSDFPSGLKDIEDWTEDWTWMRHSVDYDKI